MKLRCLELFSGAGGAALGLKRAGFHHAGLVERNSSACQTLRAAGFSNVIQADVSDIEFIQNAIGSKSIDLLWSSFPCQCWSMAGNRKGAHDDRNGWPITFRWIQLVRPNVFIGENVRGILNHSKNCGDPEHCPGCYSKEVIQKQLESVFKHVQILVLNAADYGVPQRRIRVFFVGSNKAWNAPRPTHSRNGGMFSAPWVSMAEALNLHDVIAIGGGTNPPKDHPELRTHRVITHEPSTTISASLSGNQGPWLAPSPSISTTIYSGIGGSGGQNALEKLTGRRGLTIPECACIQGFPEGYPFQGSTRDIYRQIGNAVPPRLSEVLAHSLFTAPT